MKNQIVLVLLAAISIFFFLPKNEMLKDANGKILNANVETLYPKIKEKFDEAEVKFLPKVEKDEVLGPNKDAAKCVCKGTGKILQGDGHVTECPFHGKVKKEEPLPEVKQTPVIEVRVPVVEKVSYKKYNNSAQKTERQIIIFGAEWCGPCKSFKKTVIPELKKLGFEVSDKVSAHFRTLDVDTNRQFYDSVRGNLNAIPMFVEVVNNVVVSREAKAFTLEQVLEKYTEK